VTQHVEVVDAVGAGGHAGHDRADLAGWVHSGRGYRRVVDPHRVGDQFVQAGVLGQLHDRDQARARHEILIVELDCGPPPRPR
jgi:hypothetical protein